MILDNPFHVLGLVADSGTADRTRREAYVRRYLEVGRALDFGSDDLCFPGCRRNQATAERAIRQLQDAEQRLKYGLFWFTRSGIADSVALGRLARGDLRGALDDLARVEKRPVTANNISSISNLGTLCLLVALKPPRSVPMTPSEQTAMAMRGVAAKARMVGQADGDDLRQYVATFSDDIVARDINRVIRSFDEALKKLLGEADKYGLAVPTRDVVHALESGGERCRVVQEGLASDVRQELETAVRRCKSGVARDGAKGYREARTLMTSARVQLPTLAATSGRFVHDMLANRVADAILGAAVAYFKYAWANADADGKIEILDRIEPVNRYAGEVATDGANRGRAEQVLNVLATERERLVRWVAAHRLQEWFDTSKDPSDRRIEPKERFEFLRDNLDVSSPASAISRLQAYREAGIGHFGLAFSWSDGFLHFASRICNILTDHLDVLMNHLDKGVSEGSGSLVSQAKQIVQRMRAAFVFVQQRGPEDYVFPVKEEAYARLLGMAKRFAPPPPPPRLRDAPLVALFAWAVVVVAAAALFLWISSSHSSRGGEVPPGRSVLLESDYDLPEYGAMGEILTIPQIRWCLRQAIRVEAIQPRVQTNAGRDSVAEMVIDYNGRCGSFLHRDGDIERARGDVEPLRGRIVAAAARTAERFDGGN